MLYVDLQGSCGDVVDRNRRRQERIANSKVFLRPKHEASERRQGQETASCSGACGKAAPSGRYRGIQWGDTFAELASYARIRWGEC